MKKIILITSAIAIILACSSESSETSFADRGYSSIEKGKVTLGLKEKNFLGSGRSVNLSASVSDTAADYRLGLTEPYFLNRNLSGSFEVFNEDVEADTVDIEREGVIKSQINEGSSVVSNSVIASWDSKGFN